MSLLPDNNFSGNFKSARAKVAPKAVFAYLNFHKEDVREILYSCRIDGCFDIHNVRKELAEHLRYGGVYAIELEDLNQYLTIIFNWRGNNAT